MRDLFIGEFPENVKNSMRRGYGGACASIEGLKKPHSEI
jgi:hypothetical protein